LKDTPGEMIASNLGGGQGEMFGRTLPVSAAQAPFAFDKIQFGETVSGGIEQPIQLPGGIDIESVAVQCLSHGRGIGPASLVQGFAQRGQRVALTEYPFQKTHLLQYPRCVFFR
jgi:hypothetical protein